MALRVPYTIIAEAETDDYRSWTIVQNGEFRSYFRDKVEGIVDVRIYRLESDDTVLETYPQTH